MGLADLVKGMELPSAFLLIAAWSFGWLACVKIRVEPMRRELDEAKLELRQFIEAAKAKLLGGS